MNVPLPTLIVRACDMYAIQKVVLADQYTGASKDILLCMAVTIDAVNEQEFSVFVGFGFYDSFSARPHRHFAF